MPLKRSLGAAVLAAIALVASACGSSHARTVTSSGLMLDGTVRCTVKLTTPVQAGHELSAVFSFHNISKRTVKVNLAYGGMWVVVNSPDGTTYDTRVLFENVPGYVPPTPIAPGETTTETLRNVRVRWEGPLRITPGCGLSPLHPVRVAVTSPGLPASSREAVSAVVSVAGHLLDHCRPTTPGVPVVGRIDPPSGDAPPLQARCSVSLRRERGFFAAQVFIVSPPDLEMRVQPPYEALTGPTVHGRNTEAIAWEFVVTRQGAMSVVSTEADTSRLGGGMAPNWRWTGSEWLGPGGSRCGGGGSAGGFDGPNISFVSVCGR